MALDDIGDAVQADEKVLTPSDPIIAELRRTYPDRRDDTYELLAFFAYEHLPRYLQDVSALCAVTAHSMVRRLPDGRELTAGLRKLLEAKDCFVRHAVVLHRRTTEEN